MSVFNTVQPVTTDRQRLVASDLNLVELKHRLAARVAARHDREPCAVWSREEIARLVIQELIDSRFDWNSPHRLSDVKAVLVETYRLIRADGRTWRIDGDHG